MREMMAETGDVIVLGENGDVIHTMGLHVTALNLPPGPDSSEVVKGPRDGCRSFNANTILKHWYVIDLLKVPFNFCYSNINTG